MKNQHKLKPAGGAFGRLLRDLRIRRGLCQNQLAERSGISETTINQVELGKRSPQGYVLEHLLMALHAHIVIVDDEVSP